LGQIFAPKIKTMNDWINQKRLCRNIRTQDEEDDAYLKRSCSGKFQHSTLESANKEALRMSAKNRLEKVFNSYECEFCGNYHIGRRKEDD
jgi:hypothetical protein